MNMVTFTDSRIISPKDSEKERIRQKQTDTSYSERVLCKDQPYGGTGIFYLVTEPAAGRFLVYKQEIQNMSIWIKTDKENVDCRTDIDSETMNTRGEQKNENIIR